MSYPILRLKKGKEKSLLRFHPWIFSGAVEIVPETGRDALVQVQDHVGSLIGFGFLEQKSQIVCRLFAFTKENMVLDTAYWHAKLEMAHAFKTRLFDPAYTNCFRLIHAEGDDFPGLIVDVYATTAVVQFRATGTWHLRDTIAFGLRRLGYTHIFSKNPVYSDWGQNWLGEPGIERTDVLENGLRFSVDVVKGQKTGFFLDQRDNRRLLSGYAKGRTALNCFSYTGGFSVYALAGGATHVTSVDISKDAVEIAHLNAKLNGFEAKHTAVAADCFDFLRKTDQKYDLIVLDPPAFSKDIRSVPQATRGYKDINLRAMKMIEPGGLLFTFSCSQHISRDLFQKIIAGAAVDSGRKVRILHHMSQAPDHPTNIYHPEGDYLKGLVVEVV